MKRFCLLLILLLSTRVSAQVDENLKAVLFSKVEANLAKARAEQAGILSPKLFEEANKKYNEALKSFQSGKSLKDLEKKIDAVNRVLDQCLQVTKLGRVTFTTTLKAREDALKANAPEHASEAFAEAESRFRSATRKLEKGDVKSAKKSIPELDRLYRTAELTAVKASIMGKVRNLIQQARREEAHEYTPITYANAQKLLSEAEAILNSSRRSEANAREKAEAAAVEARHALFLTRQIKRLKKNPDEWENYVLDTEILIEAIAKELGFQPQFDEGLAKPLKRILMITQNLQRDKRDLLTEVDQKTRELQELQTQLQQYKEKERGLQAELQEKEYKLQLKRQHEEKIRSLHAMFSEDEAVVLQKGPNLIIRMIGLSFPSGRATIEPEYFSLLTKVQRAIRKFPNATITIEGHTDSRGNDQFNQNLSFERAQAVKQYLLANMGLDETRVTAIGYGESRPIASNETRAGRAQNRRIDIVLSFPETNL